MSGAISTLTLFRTASSVLQFLDSTLPPTLRKLCIETHISESPVTIRTLFERRAEIRPPLSGLQFSDRTPQVDQTTIHELGFLIP